MSWPGELPLPGHFDPDSVGAIRRIPYEERSAEAREWALRHRIQGSSRDSLKVGLLAVDLQNTFCLPGFELAVHGAVEDARRLCDFVYRNLARLTGVVVTLDTHCSMQIFHARFLVGQDGRHPAAMTPISLQSVEEGRWRIDPKAARHLGLSEEDAESHLLYYCRELARGGKYELMVWPYHAMLGGIGHALVPAVEEACFFHSVARSTATRFEAKGRHPLTENYSVLRPEVVRGADGQVLAVPNSELLEVLLDFDVLVVAGQAKSHCVAWTVDDLLHEIERRNPDRADRIYLLEDCTSPVRVPGGADFSRQAEEAFSRFAAAGMHRVHATEPMERWPGLGDRL